MNDKISIIIPAYNVELYIEKCIKSVLNQTYKNLEIIMIDDCSPDNCGQIIDEYAKKDSRIRSFHHHKNQGLSAARNTGLKYASGDWILMIDSDDWLEFQACEILLKKAKEYDVDIVCCGHNNVYDDKTIPHHYDSDLKMNNKEALKVLLQDKMIKSFAWDKLVRKELFENVQYPDGRLFEDIATTYKLFHKACSVLLIPDILYNYVQRSNSIMSTYSLKNRIDFYLAEKDRREELIKEYPQYKAVLDNHCAIAAVSLWSRLITYPVKERILYKEQLLAITQHVRNIVPSVLKNKRTGKTVKVSIRYAQHYTNWAMLMAWICMIPYRLKHGRPL